MTILAVHDDPEVLKQLVSGLAAADPDADILSFSASPQALAAARKTEIQAAFLKSSLPEISGLDLGLYLKDLNSVVNLIYVEETPDYAFEAMKLRASGYLLGPATREDLEYELSDLRYPKDSRKNSRFFAQTFGNFDFFIDSKPVEFKYSRTKEVLALLVNNRGAQTTNGEIIAALWEDEGDPDKKGSYLRNLRQDLQNTLSRRKAAGILIKQRGSIAIDASKIRCDLYEWLEDPKKSGYRYLGEYMNQYSWAEYLHAELDEIYYSMEEL